MSPTIVRLRAPEDRQRACGPEPEAAYCQLDAAFRAEHGPLLRYVGSRAGAEAAPDIVQEVFVRAAGSRQRGFLANPAGFLRRVARNLLIDRARSSQARPVHVTLEEMSDPGIPAGQDLELEAADLLRVYEEAVRTLPSKTRRVFLMHRVDGLTYRAIHLEVGISVATVEYHMMKALAHIAAKVSEAQ